MFWCRLMGNWVSECFEFDHYFIPIGYLKTNTEEASPTVQADSHFMVDCCSAIQKNAIILWDEPTPKIHPVHVKVRWALKMNLQHKLAMQNKQGNRQTASCDWAHHAAVQQASRLMWLVTSCSCPTSKPPQVTGHIMELSNRQATSCDWSQHGTVQSTHSALKPHNCMEC